MRLGQPFRFPREQWEQRQRAQRLAWLSLVLLTSTAIAVALTLGQSEAMRTAWIEDLIGLIPSIVLLVAFRLELRPPNPRYPYGYYSGISIAFLVTAALLALVGVWLLYDAVMKLLHGARPPIGAMTILGHEIWAGWAMIAALAYCVVIGVVLGHLKRPVADKLNDKALDADADMNKAGWMSEGAAIVGILLVGYGRWWGDAAAAGFIALNIIRDGWHNLRQVVADLMDETPTKIGTLEADELPRKVKDAAERLAWVEKAAVRLREHGHVIEGEVFVVPRDERDLVHRVEEASRELSSLDWRLYALVVMPVSRLEDGAMPKVGAAGGGR